MIFNKRWVALFSHTGKEIYNISRAIGILPDIVITNNNSETICRELRDNIPFTLCKQKPTVKDYRQLFEYDDCIVTLHGWMRIVPEEICNEYDIYNLHPGLIDQYPELKGMDPQKRVFEMKDPPEWVGCVLHRVVPEVDSGKIIVSGKTRNNYYNVDQLQSSLHTLAQSMWVDFFKWGPYK